MVAAIVSMARFGNWGEMGDRFSTPCSWTLSAKDLVEVKKEGKMACDKQIDITKHYTTVNGKKVRFYSDAGGGPYPIHGAVDWDEIGVWVPTAWTVFGVCMGYGVYNLVEEKKKIKRSIVVSDLESALAYSNHDSAVAAARRLRSSCYTTKFIAVVEVEVEDGQGF